MTLAAAQQVTHRVVTGEIDSYSDGLQTAVTLL
jgi:hypothetical protein